MSASRRQDDPHRLRSPGSRARARCTCGSATARSRTSAADLRAAAVLRGVPARPLVHRAARHHGAHLRHLPGRVPDERVPRRWRTRCGVEVDGPLARAAAAPLLRRVDREPRAARLPAARAGLPRLRRARSRWRATTATSSSGGCAEEGRQRDDGVVGGREIHPINVRVGGFYRAPTRRELRAAARAARARARDGAARPCAWAGALDFPDFEHDLRAGRAARAGRVRDRARAARRPNRGLDIAPRIQRPRRRGARRSTRPRCTRGCAGGGAYLAGPLARYALNFEPLSPAGARGRAGGRARPRRARNPFRSIVVRAVEIAVRAATRRCGSSTATSRPSRRPSRSSRAPASGTARPRRRAACSTTATSWTTDGTILDATIVPPTSQNQRAIEDDLRGCRRAQARSADDEELRLRCEQAIRNYDPCISCATHFLRLDVERA